MMRKNKMKCIAVIAFSTALFMSLPVMAEDGGSAPVIEAPVSVQTEYGPGMELETPVEETASLETQAVSPTEETIATENAATENETSKAVVEETQESEAVAAPAYTQEDLEVLAHAICGEAQCYPDEEQRYVGSVILNRKNHKAYPNTIKGVVFQKGQYACTWDGNYYRKPTEANWRNARWLLENGSVLPANVVYQASFKQGSGVYLQTKWHKYCYR